MDLWQKLTLIWHRMLAGAETFYLPSEPFIFVGDFVIPAVIGTTLNNQQFLLSNDFDLYVYGISLHSTGVFSFMFKGAGGGVQFGNAPVRSDTFWNATNPTLFLRRPFKIMRTANLLVDLTNQIAGANTVEIALLCWKSASQYASPTTQDVLGNPYEL